MSTVILIIHSSVTTDPLTMVEKIVNVFMHLGTFLIWSIRACLVINFKLIFSHFKQYYTHFYTHFYLHVFQKVTNNNSQTTLQNTPLLLFNLCLFFWIYLICVLSHSLTWPKFIISLLLLRIGNWQPTAHWKFCNISDQSPPFLSKIWNKRKKKGDRKSVV